MIPNAGGPKEMLFCAKYAFHEVCVTVCVQKVESANWTAFANICLETFCRQFQQINIDVYKRTPLLTVLK